MSKAITNWTLRESADATCRFFMTSGPSVSASHPSARAAMVPTDYWKILKFPSNHHSRMKIRMVDRHPPPIFHAPTPATNPRRALLIISPWCLLLSPLAAAPCQPEDSALYSLEQIAFQSFYTHLPCPLRMFWRQAHSLSGRSVSLFPLRKWSL